MSKDVELFVHLFVYLKSMADDVHPLKSPRKSQKNEFWMSNSHEIGSSLVSFKMIFEALQSKLPRFEFQSLSSKILKIPEFSLVILFKRFMMGSIKKFYSWKIDG